MDISGESKKNLGEVIDDIMADFGDNLLENPLPYLWIMLRIWQRKENSL